MNHKRRRAKSRRAGCLLCKPHKANGCEVERAGVVRQTQDDVRDLAADAVDERAERKRLARFDIDADVNECSCSFCMVDECIALRCPGCGYCEWEHAYYARIGVPLAAPLLEIARAA